MDRDPKQPNRAEKELPKDYWSALRDRLHEAAGDVPSPLEIRSHAMCRALGIPTGAYSAITMREGGRTLEDVERDRIIGEDLTNKPGIIIDEKHGVTSRDFRDLYPGGLPARLSNVLDQRTRAIMEIEFRHRAAIPRQHSGLFTHDCPIEYHRLPGADLFLRGYMHDEEWQQQHGAFLMEANVNAAVLCIEGFMSVPLGISLEKMYHDPAESDYGALMREAVGAGFTGIFTEVDARDNSRIRTEPSADVLGVARVPLNLPDSFFKTYGRFLEREHPRLAEAIERSGGLRIVLRAQSQAIQSSDDYHDRPRPVSKDATTYSTFQHATERGGYSLEPTYLELGKHMFSDALSAIKLHLIARLMAIGYVPHGPIIEYRGAAHTANTGFFLKYPEYAMEVALRSVHEVMAGKVGRLHARLRGVRSVYHHFNRPNWEKILREIVRIPVGRVAGGHMHAEDLDVLKALDVDRKLALPSEKDIERIQQIARDG